MIRHSFIGCSLMLCISLSANARTKFALVAEKMNVAYVGINNPLKLLYPGIPCENLWLKTNNGVISKSEACSFDITPTKHGGAMIYVCRIAGRDTIKVDSVRFRTPALPKPHASIGGRHDEGSIPANILKAQLGVAATIEGFDFDVRIVIKSFKLMLLRKEGSSEEFATNSGPYFSDEMKKAIDKVGPADRILIFAIRAAGPVDKDIKLEPMMLTVQ